MSYPNIIYKYRDWDHELQKRILSNNELYFASPKDFNDPFDCRISKNFHLLNTQEKRKNFVDNMIIESFDIWRTLPKSIPETIKEMDERLIDLEKIGKDYEKIFFHEYDLHYGVICFSAIWNDILMWSHYAKCHQGICIGFYEEKIRKSPPFQGAGGMVMYDSKYPDIDPLDKDTIKEMFLTTHYKSSQWKYEAEYRISKLYYPQIPTTKDRVLNFTNDFIAEVILGLNINEANKSEVISICTEKNIPVYQAIKIPRKFYVSCTPLYQDIKN